MFTTVDVLSIHISADQDCKIVTKGDVYTLVEMFTVVDLCDQCASVQRPTEPDV